MRALGAVCYCGSGKKFRKCHGAVDGPRVSNLDDAANVMRPVFAEVAGAARGVAPARLMSDVLHVSR